MNTNLPAPIDFILKDLLFRDFFASWFALSQFPLRRLESNRFDFPVNHCDKAGISINKMIQRRLTPAKSLNAKNEEMQADSSLSRETNLIPQEACLNSIILP